MEIDGIFISVLATSTVSHWLTWWLSKQNHIRFAQWFFEHCTKISLLSKIFFYEVKLTVWLHSENRNQRSSNFKELLLTRSCNYRAVVRCTQRQTPWPFWESGSIPNEPHSSINDSFTVPDELELQAPCYYYSRRIRTT